MHPVFIHTISYGVVLIIALLIVSIMFKGFFFPYLRVRLSFGRLILVKLKAVNRDYFKGGKVEEGFLVFKGTSGERRVSIPSSEYFYRCLSVSWIDLDDEKSIIMKPDLKGIIGFDSQKYNSLYLRALYAPSITSTYEKYILIGVGAMLLLLIITLYLVYQFGVDLTGVTQALEDAIKTNTISASGGL